MDPLLIFVTDRLLDNKLNRAKQAKTYSKLNQKGLWS